MYLSNYGSKILDIEIAFEKMEGIKLKKPHRGNSLKFYIEP